MLSTFALGDSKPANDPRPEWAIRAAVEFSKSWQVFPRTKQAQSENYRLGLMCGVVSRLPTPKGLAMEPAFCAAVSPEALALLLHAELAKAPACDAAEFYSGFADGLKQGDLSTRPRCVIYLILALVWPELSQLKNVTEIHSWFETNLGPNLTGTRDRVAKICQGIGLRPTDKGGRPKAKPRKAPRS